MRDQPLLHRVPIAAHEPPRALVLVHLKQPLSGARVHDRGDEDLDLQALARQGMFVVSNAPSGSDAASVLDRRRRQILHVVPGSSDVVPKELTLCQSFIKLSHQELGCVRREGGDEARMSIVSMRVVLGHDGLARGAIGEAEVVDHG